LIRDDQRNTLLHIYVKANDRVSVNIIIEIYIDIFGISEKFYNFLFLKNINGFTAFDLSVKYEYIAIIKILYEQLEKSENDCNISNYMEYLKNNIFNVAAENNKIYPILFFYEKLKKFYKRKSIKLLDCKDDNLNKEGMTPILYASKNGNLKLLLILIDLGADINSINDKGYTALHYAVENNDERMVKHLLIRGANKFVNDRDNINPYNLAVLLRQENLIKILYHKNCCQKLFCGEELGKLSGKSSMILMIFYLILNIGFKLAIFFRLFFVIYNIDLFLLLSDFKIHNDTNIQEIALNDLLSCVEENCFPEVIALFSCIIIDLLLLIYFIIFKCSKPVFLPRKINREKNLSKLYERNENICIKCGIIKSSSTKHCLICDRCVENWDHHCYWLNTCISNKNFCKFKLFLYFTFIFLITNLLFYIYSVYLILSAKDLFFQEIFNIEIGSEVYYLVLILLISFLGVLIIIVIYSIIFVNFPLVNYYCKVNISNNNIEENVQSLIDSEDSFNRIFEDN
jgi:ankyrin repeat protein